MLLLAIKYEINSSRIRIHNYWFSAKRAQHTTTSTRSHFAGTKLCSCQVSNAYSMEIVFLRFWRTALDDWHSIHWTYQEKKMSLPTKSYRRHWIRKETRRWSIEKSYALTFTAIWCVVWIDFRAHIYRSFNRTCGGFAPTHVFTFAVSVRVNLLACARHRRYV